MNPDVIEIEFLNLLRRVCRTTRNMRNRPELSIPAAQWELRINQRLEDLESSRPKAEVAPEGGK